METQKLEAEWRTNRRKTTRPDTETVSTNRLIFQLLCLACRYPRSGIGPLIKNVENLKLSDQDIEDTERDMNDGYTKLATGHFRVVEMANEEHEAGASKRQAAERAVAKFGPWMGHSFEAVVTDVRKHHIKVANKK